MEGESCGMPPNTLSREYSSSSPFEGARHTKGDTSHRGYLRMP